MNSILSIDNIYDIPLVTDAGCPINKADVEVVVEQFAKMDAGLNVMYVALADLMYYPFPWYNE